MRILSLLLLLAAPAWAEAPPVTADLDGDGRTESYALVPGEVTVVDLVVEGPEGTAVYPAVAWQGAMAGQEASLALSPSGSLWILSGNDAVGRGRWSLTLTVAHRDGALRVAGVTYARRDTIDPGDWGTCDVNLLSGRGVMTDPSGEREAAAPSPAPALADWRESDLPDLLPEGCLG